MVSPRRPTAPQHTPPEQTQPKKGPEEAPGETVVLHGQGSRSQPAATEAPASNETSVATPAPALAPDETLVAPNASAGGGQNRSQDKSGVPERGILRESAAPPTSANTTDKPQRVFVQSAPARHERHSSKSLLVVALAVAALVALALMLIILSHL